MDNLKLVKTEDKTVNNYFDGYYHNQDTGGVIAITHDLPDNMIGLRINDAHMLITKEECVMLAYTLNLTDPRATGKDLSTTKWWKECRVRMLKYYTQPPSNNSHNDLVDALKNLIDAVRKHSGSEYTQSIYALNDAADEAAEALRKTGEMV